MIKLFTFFLFFSTLTAIAQNDNEYWAKWDKNYRQIDLEKILIHEKHYADSIESHPDIPPYYIRLDKYKFKAVYLAKTRTLDKSVSTSMRNVFKLVAGDPSQLENLCKTEALFKVGNEELWMPIQQEILNALKNESHKGEQLNLYCLYFNEHTNDNVLYNTFLISEFSK